MYEKYIKQHKYIDVNTETTKMLIRAGEFKEFLENECILFDSITIKPYVLRFNVFVDEDELQTVKDGIDNILFFDAIVEVK